MSIPQQGKALQDLEERAFLFAKNVRDFIQKLPRTIANIEYAKQVIRSSGSIGANYIEANESLGSRDCLMRMRICRKEAKESRLWLRLCDLEGRAILESERCALIQEAKEFLLIFSAIIRNAEVRSEA